VHSTSIAIQSAAALAWRNQSVRRCRAACRDVPPNTFYNIIGNAPGKPGGAVDLSRSVLQAQFGKRGFECRSFTKSGKEHPCGAPRSANPGGPPDASLGRRRTVRDRAIRAWRVDLAPDGDGVFFGAFRQAGRWPGAEDRPFKRTFWWRWGRDGGDQGHRSRLWAGRLKNDGSESSSCLQCLTAGRRLRRCTRLQTQAHEELLDHRRFQDHRDDLQFAAKLSAVSVSCWPMDRKQTLHGGHHRRNSMNGRDPILQTGRSWSTDLEHCGARGVEGPLRSGESGPFLEVRADHVPHIDPSASRLDPQPSSAALISWRQSRQSDHYPRT
jgi:hypothetical protein